ncbi:CAP domain-containing protein [Demequina activiva]|uniref:SCP domain-containing protein n=1 Tax=Demequina activiva TaxID=1582364 RepID=A0A919Q3U1_9MICO|nr:CAP domain-containing protein [Demequina activiva]GIG53793.1 hypothetical protein Dac01nite_05450 [Demequina activiva]
MTADARVRRRTAAALALAVAAFAGCSSPADAPVALPDAVEYAQEVFEGTNAERAQAGLEPLEWSECLLPVAQERVHVVAVTGELQHAPLAATCNDGATAGENLSRAAEQPQQIVDRWMASPGHEANVLNPAFRTVAVACVASDDEGGPMTCSWVAEGLPPDHPDYEEYDDGPVVG